MFRYETERGDKIMNEPRTWLIEKRGELTQEYVAQLSGISRGAYANIELGERNPSVNAAKRIASVLKFEWTIFFTQNSFVSKQTRSSSA